MIFRYRRNKTYNIIHINNTIIAKDSPEYISQKNMSLTIQEKEKIFKKFGNNAKDSGSTYSQIALFTNDIR